jgi:plasmid stabilization system protein ParE
MNALFQLTPQAIQDLDAIWLTIAEDNRDAAERVEMEIRDLSSAGKTSADGHKATGHHGAASPVLDCHEVPELRDRLPSRNRPVAGGRRSARKA